MLRITGTIKSQSVDVTTAATQIPSSNLGSRRGCLLYNAGAENVELGGSGVTFGEGVPLKPGQYLPLVISDNAKIYGIAQNGTVDVRVLEAY